MADDLQWDSLKVDSVLNIDWHTKYIALLVNLRSSAHPDGASTVLLAQRQGFDNEMDLINLLNQSSPIASRSISLLDRNDIYYRYLVSHGDMNECKMTVIHPATPSHIAKYTKQQRQLVEETPILYSSIIEPWIREHGMARLRWVENILSGVSEQERTLYREDSKEDGFILLPDGKWDQQSLSSLYLLAIAYRRDVRSLRDLTGEHLPLLRNIRDQVRRVVQEQFQLDPRKVRMYVHYQPTYYYFHVHIVHVDLETAGSSVGIAHLLDDIIDNITSISSDYYQRRTLYYYIGCEHDLARQMLKDGFVSDKSNLDPSPLSGLEL